ncbi:MAG: hypothetical protein U0401_10265 [Anaerolineae bacterium]
MEQTQPYLVGLKFFERFTLGYAHLIFQTMDWNFRQFKAVTGQVDEAAKQVLPQSLGPAQSNELTELKKQVEFLTERVNSLEKSKKSSAWNKSGEGHWAMQK